MPTDQCAQSGRAARLGAGALGAERLQLLTSGATPFPPTRLQTLRGGRAEARAGAGAGAVRRSAGDRKPVGTAQRRVQRIFTNAARLVAVSVARFDVTNAAGEDESDYERRPVRGL